MLIIQKNYINILKYYMCVRVCMYRCYVFNIFFSE